MKSISQVLEVNEHLKDKYEHWLENKKIQKLHEVQAKDIMSAGIVTISSKDLITAAIQLFLKEKITALLVVDQKDNPVGVFSETDLARYERERAERPVMLDDLMAINQMRSEDIPEVMGMRMVTTLDDVVEDWMTPLVITVKTDDNIETVAKVLTNNGIHRVFVENNSKLVGIVSSMDVVASIAMLSTERIFGHV